MPPRLPIARMGTACLTQLFRGCGLRVWKAIGVFVNPNQDSVFWEVWRLELCTGLGAEDFAASKSRLAELEPGKA